MSKAVVLSSGGVDSTTCIGFACRDLGSENVITVSCYYGQKHEKELECAAKIAAHYAVSHFELDLSQIFIGGSCPLLKHSVEDVPEGSYAEQTKTTNGGPVATYVPFRNGLMVSAVTSFAMSLFPDETDIQIYLGAHADDAAGNAYADCSIDFVTALDKAIREGTYNRVSLRTPLVAMNKAQVVKSGLFMKVPYELTWSCYNGGSTPCGKCGTCIDRANAFAANNVSDPALEVN